MWEQIYKNGELWQPTAAEVLHERAFVYADGCFETMRVVNGSIPLWRFHRARLQQALAHLRLCIDLDLLEAEAERCAELAESDSAVLKLILSRAGQSRASYALDNAACHYFSHLKAYTPNSARRSGIHLRSALAALPARPQLAGLKLLERLEYSVLSAGIQLRDNQELVFFDEREQCIETMHHNLWLLSEGRLVTPQLLKRGVSGCFRAHMLSLRSELSVELIEAPISRQDIFSAESVAISNATEGLLAVVALDGRNLSLSASMTELISRVNRVFA